MATGHFVVKAKKWMADTLSGTKMMSARIM
jgi:hypothetical protein